MLLAITQKEEYGMKCLACTQHGVVSKQLSDLSAATIE